MPVDLMENRELSTTARLALMYMISLTSRPGWHIYVAQIRRELGMGKAAWLNARRQLEANGYLKSERLQRSDGTWQWVHLVTDTPGSLDEASITDSKTSDVTMGGLPDHGSSDHGSPADGSSTHGSPDPIRTNTEHKNKETTTTTQGTARKLIVPAGLTDKEVVVVEDLVERLDATRAQAVLDELAGAMLRKGTIRKSHVSFTRALVSRAQDGTFRPSLGIEVAAKRDRDKKQRQEQLKARKKREERERRAQSPESRRAAKEALKKCNAMLGRSYTDAARSKNASSSMDGSP